MSEYERNLVRDIVDVIESVIQQVRNNQLAINDIQFLRFEPRKIIWERKRQ